MFLSKTDYMMAYGCVKALWLKKNRKYLIPEVDNTMQAIFDTGNEIQDWARLYFDEGIMVEAEPWDVINGAKLTFEMSKTNNTLFEAFAQTPSGAFCRIDVLKKNGNGWDLIEIKGSSSVKDEHITDLAFQSYVFNNAGYKIKNCYVLHLNKDYVRKGKLDIKKLFKLEKLTEEVFANYAEVEELAPKFLKIQKNSNEPDMPLYKDCLDCQFFEHCGKDLPQYSIFNLFRADVANDLYESRKTAEITPDILKYCSGNTLVDAEAFLSQNNSIDKPKIKEFLDSLEYPLYYLDYETIMPAIPLFGNSSPYNQIPFQLSLHIQNKKGGDLKHTGFLHKEKTDPRRLLAEFLIKSCGKKGSVIVYNESFEKSRNIELANLFPDLAKDLLAINDRVVDLLIPFRNRALYSYKQESSASIKKVLPAWTNENYDNMKIANGGEAMNQYLAFVKGLLSTEEEQALFKNLEAYCHKDTFAMVELVKVLYNNA